MKAQLNIGSAKKKMTPQQYLEILFIDTGFDRAQRNAWLTDRCGRKISFLDELRPGEISTVIDCLKEMKDEQQEAYRDGLDKEDFYGE